jgi:hypothetical protein
MWCNDSDKIHGGRMKEMKIFSGIKERNNQTPIAFLKFVCSNAEKFLVWFCLLLLSITTLLSFSFIYLCR